MLLVSLMMTALKKNLKVWEQMDGLDGRAICRSKDDRRLRQNAYSPVLTSYPPWLWLGCARMPKEY